MEHYGNLQPFAQAPTASSNTRSSKSANALAVDYVDQIWNKICARDQKGKDYANSWLENERGIVNPRFFIGSGFATLYQEDIELFEQTHHGLLEQRLLLGPNLIAPIRSINSAKVENLFFRSINATNKDQKSRLLTGAGGFGDGDNGLRAFGFPHLIHEFSNLVLCEGMADYFSAEFLLDADEKFLPIGAANADALIKWALWLVRANYKGKVVIIFHIDSNQNDEISAEETGPAKAIRAAKILKEHQILVQIFPWISYLKNSTTKPQNVRDLADSLKQELLDKECGTDHLQEMFRILLNGEGD